MSDRHLYRAAASVARVGWLILPVIVAGIGHVVVLKTDALEWIAIPLDGGRQWRARPLLGPNKTWRGILLMTTLTAGCTHLQSTLGQRWRGRIFSVSRDCRTSPWMVGGVTGLSYCLAELPNSFVKRRLGVQAGARAARAPRLQYVVDQVDSVLGCLIALRLYYRPSRSEVAMAFVLGSAIHMGLDGLLYALGVKRRNG